ncbi:MAG: Lrp/AsnC family transcriptional regulator [Deltaproteobacteria bacterium]|jgi:siroheme decarboxylase|nr:Lrp/AsnC family transcriptional regulator [Deltaproteobacteria bacterium]
MLTDLEKKVVAAVQGDLPVTAEPYRDIADDLGVSEDTLLKTLKSLRDRGIMRRFGATLRHQKSGFKANAMVAWQVEAARTDEVGEVFAAFGEVSHCYQRSPAEDWPYNLYTMVHAVDEDECRATAARMAEKAAVPVYTLLFSRQELKKTSMQYFV